VSRGKHQESSESGSKLNPAALPYQSSTLLVDTSRTVILEKAQANCFNLTKPLQKLKLQFILDSGSQQSYITERAKATLMLKSEGERMMSVVTFGSTKGTQLKCKSVRLGVETKEGDSLELLLLSVPTICEPLHSISLERCLVRYKHLQGLEYADISNVQGVIEPDVLIGSDHYWEIVTGENLRGRDGPTASHTNLGWVFSGPLTTDSDEQNDSYSFIVHTFDVTENSVREGLSLDEQLKAF
jgi:hypothetical protein